MLYLLIVLNILFSLFILYKINKINKKLYFSASDSDFIDTKDDDDDDPFPFKKEEETLKQKTFLKRIPKDPLQGKKLEEILFSNNK